MQGPKDFTFYYKLRMIKKRKRKECKKNASNFGVKDSLIIFAESYREDLFLLMDSNEITQLLNATIRTLSGTGNISKLYHRHKDTDSLPSGQVISEIIDLCRAVIFPGYYGKSTINSQTVLYTIGVSVERIYELLRQQIKASLNFYNEEQDRGCTDNPSACAADMAAALIRKLPEIRLALASDVDAAYLGDPAAENYGEVISCYPVIKAMTNYRIAHELYKTGVPLMPRILTEMAHSETGIDIHPGAEIGHHFMIDHGTGVVIGATCIIGNNVKLYQGVTLGAKSFPLDENGNPIKHIPRHPILQDDVIVYSNATILGRVTIGKGAVIGGNIWVNYDVPAGARLSQKKHTPSK